MRLNEITCSLFTFTAIATAYADAGGGDDGYTFYWHHQPEHGRMFNFNLKLRRGS